MLIGVLGVLKAGGAYVPFDPAYPADRLAFMLKDASPKVLLVGERLEERFRDSAVEQIALDKYIGGGSSEREDVNTVAGDLSSKNLAYVIVYVGIHRST